MKIERRNPSDERRILTGMITRRDVLSRVAQVWQPDLFRNRWANLVGSWCVKYFHKYNAAPQQDIEPIFAQWSEKKEGEQVDLVEKFLSSLSGEYESLADDINGDHLSDLAARYFNRERLRKLKDQLEEHLDSGQIDEADALVVKQSRNRIELGTSEMIDVLSDADAIREAMSDEARQVLIKFPGALGTFFRDSLEREGFIAIMAPEKRGKTWWLQKMAWAAMLQRRRVAFFGAGDMSRSQMLRRLMTLGNRRPLKPGTVSVPRVTDEENPQDWDFTEKTWEDRLDWRDALRKCKEIRKRRLKTKSPLLKLACYPNSTLTVDHIETVLDRLDNDDWVADVVVIDYADILAHPKGVSDPRERINENWKALRALSQRRHCLVITATQAKASSYNVRTLNMSHFADDKRKFAHATGIFAINQTTKEKPKGIQRLNWVVLREDEFFVSRCVHVVGQLKIGDPAIVSFIKRKRKKESDDE